MATVTEDEEKGGNDVRRLPHAVSRGTPRERVNPIHDGQGCVRSFDLMAMPPNNSLLQDRSEFFSEKFNFLPESKTTTKDANRGWCSFRISLHQPRTRGI